ncbi:MULTISPECIES: FAD-dependent oxidoreductase [Pseudomonas]|uniref:NAD(P)/FAD-dependent oxidoreductase n=1 Tax=Pseudomonas TaxID=286 RepID=UPI000CD4A7AE|nr:MULTISPECIES: FAD-dependent oxidoreductase [Pseudomonas]RBH57589.1 pyridine nucleotide-disulfide oxidoreductase [Pseudomonas sp. MWU13-2860]
MNIGNAPLVIVGAGHAGGRAALTLRDEGYSGRLILIGDETHPPYERPPLSKGLLLGAQALGDYSLSDRSQLAGLEIEHLSGTTVQHLDTQGHRLQLADGGWLPYGRLLLTTGGRARRLPNVPEHWRNVLYLRTHDEAMALREGLRPETRLVIVGGGFIGLEVAASARALGCHVTLLEAGPRLAGRVLPQRLSEALLALHRSQGVEVRLGVVIEAVEGGEQAEAVRLVDGRRLPCDLLLVGIGMQPNIELARAAGLEVGQGIRVDAQLCSSAPDVFAAGDVCEFRLHPQGAFQRQETWRNAEAQGRHAALNLLGAELPFEMIPGFWSDQYDWGLQTVGVIAGSEPSVSRTLSGGAFLLFYLDAERRLQGACAWGPGNSGARDIKLCERLIASRIPLDVHLLADASVPLKPLLRN